MKPESSAQDGGGLSRAAKKRAKKNKNKMGENKRSPESTAEEETIPVLTKRVKLDQQGGKDGNVIREKSQGGSSEKGTTKRSEGADAGPEAEAAISFDDPDDADIPSFPDTPLVEILLLKDVNDEAKRAVLQSLTSKQRAACLLQAIIDPIPLDDFYQEFWEKKPLLVRAKNKTRYEGLLSLESIKEMSKKHKLYYARDLNVTKYKKSIDGVKRRITLDKLPEDEVDQETGVLVDKAELWSDYEKGCTIRLLRPHKHEDHIHALLSTLEVELQCMVGANAYLTPPNSAQGFAPHYDDIEAFCLQLQGSKRWKVYEPKLKLPRVSSEDFTLEDLEGMEPVLDITLEEGDLLYMPRGWIHQACTLPDNNEHSLHLTVSAMQQWAWVDLLETIMPEALEAAAMNETNTSLRQGLPRGFLDYMGAMHENPSDEKLPDSLKKRAGEDAAENAQVRQRKLLQEKFRAEAKKKIMKVAKTAHEMLDAACDEIAKRFMSDRQPPALTERELAATNNGDDGKDRKEEILPNTLCRLARPGIARLIIEDDQAVVYHCVDNAREFQGTALSPIEYDMDDGAALEQLLTTVEPHWIFVNDLFHDTIQDKVAIASSLYDEGILAIKNPDAS